MTIDNLVRKLHDEKIWRPVLDQLAEVPLPDRPKLISKWCLQAANEHDDKEALRLYGWLTLAWQDTRGQGANYSLALHAIELHESLPAYRKSREYEDRERNREVEVQHQTLVGLKTKLLTDIAVHWSATRDQAEASRLAAFLLLTAKSRDSEVIGRLDAALHEAMKSIWKKERVLSFMWQIVKETKQDDLAHTLLMGVFRMLRCRELEVLGPLFVALPFDTLRGSHNELGGETLCAGLARDAHTRRMLYELMRHLRARLKPKKGEILTFEPDYVQQDTVELLIRALPGWTERGQEENAFHDLFDDLRAQIRAWMDVRAQAGAGQKAPIIKLKVCWPVSHGEPRCVREDQLRPS